MLSDLESEAVYSEPVGAPVSFEKGFLYQLNSLFPISYFAPFYMVIWLGKDILLRTATGHWI